MGHKFSSSSQVRLTALTYFYAVLFKAFSTHISSLAELSEEDRERWEAFTSGQLADTNKKNTVDLVSVLSFVVFVLGCLKVALIA